jgi:hypothetical protein
MSFVCIIAGWYRLSGVINKSDIHRSGTAAAVTLFSVITTFFTVR